MKHPELNLTEAGTRIARGQALPAGQPATVWQVRHGAFRLDRPTDTGQSFVHLALPGDWVGVEALCARPAEGTAVALFDSIVIADPVVGQRALIERLAATLAQQQRQTLDMTRLRSGTVRTRLTRLLQLFARSVDTEVAALDRKTLPALLDMAQIVDATRESVCRELAVLLPPSRRPASPPAPRRRWLTALAAAPLLAVSVSAQAHGHAAGDLTLDHPYATPSPAGATGGEAFLRGIMNRSDQPDRLTGARTSVAECVELQQVTWSEGAMRMYPVSAIDLPAQSETSLRQGSKHLFKLINLKQPLKNGDSFDLTLHFERAGNQTVRVGVQTPRAAKVMSSQN